MFEKFWDMVLKLCGGDESCVKVFKLSLIYSTTMSIYTILRHEFFQTRAYDFGIFIQALWSTLRAGKFFYETPDLGISETGSFFGVHFSPIMFLVLLIYAIAPHPYTLLVFQSFLLGFAAIPLYKLAKLVMNEDGKALLLSSTYLIYPPILATNLFDFHLEAFYPIIIFSALYYLEKEDFKKFYALILFNLTILDFASLVITLSLAFYGSVIKYRRFLLNPLKMSKRIGLHVIISMVGIVSLTYLYYQIMLTIIQQLGVPPFSKTLNWSKLGSNLSEIVGGLMVPEKVIASIQYDFVKKILWLFFIFLPLLFIPILAPIELLPGLPIFTAFLLSTYHAYYELGWQYGAIYSPFVFYAAIYGFERIRDSSFDVNNPLRSLIKPFKKIAEMDNKKLQGLIIIVVVLSTAVGLGVRDKSYVFEGTAFADPIPIPSDHIFNLKKVLALIPKNASVLAQNNIFPHLAERLHAYTWLPPDSGAIVDYAIGDISHPEFYMPIPNENFTYSQIFYMLLDTGQYGVYALVDSIILIKKNYNGEPVLLKPVRELYNYNTIGRTLGKVVSESSSIEKYVVEFNAKTKRVMWYKYKPLPMGNYTIKIRLKVKKYTSNNGDLFNIEIVDKINNYVKVNVTYSQNNTTLSEWITFEFKISVRYPSIYEIRSLSISSGFKVYFDYLEIKQTAWQITKS